MIHSYHVEIAIGRIRMLIEEASSSDMTASEIVGKLLQIVDHLAVGELAESEARIPSNPEPPPAK